MLVSLLASVASLAVAVQASGEVTPGSSPPAPNAGTVPTAAPSSSSPAAAPVTAPLTAATVGEVVVTASRRRETLQKVTSAVTAVTGLQLKQAQITQLSDLTATTPNIQIGSYTTNNNIVIRGIGNTQIVGGADPGVALLSDGVYLGQSGLAASTFLDINRVEVLRGPQGTLFGRNATGGAVDIIPNYPTSDFHYGADVAVSADPTEVRSSGYVNGALTSDGELMGRLAVQQSYNEGFTKNLLPGGPGRLDDQNNYSFRGQLAWNPTNDLNFRLLVEHQHQDDNGAAQYLLGVPNGGALPVVLQGRQGVLDDRTIYANQGSDKLDSTIVDLNGDLKLGGGDLKLLLSYDLTHQLTNTDGDGTANDFTSSIFINTAHQYYAELVYASDPKQRFNYILGANFYNEKLSQSVDVPIAAFPTPDDVIPVLEGGGIYTWSYAAFAHAQYVVAPKFRLFGGLRFTADRKALSEYNNFAGEDTNRKQFQRLTYEGGASYDFNPHLTGYAKYATGFKSGGFTLGSLLPAFNPETDADTEAGLKGFLLNGKLQANLAGFHTTYNNLQVSQVRGATSVVTNAAQATIDGAEAEVNLKPMQNLRLQVAAAYLNARFDQFITSDSARPELGTLSLAGNELPQAPHFTVSSGAYYDIHLPEHGVVTLSARGDWKSTVFFNEFNESVASQASKGKVSLNVLWISPDQRWTASAFALNVTDAHILGNVTVVSALLGSAAIGSLQPGREVGFSAGYHF